MTAIGYSPFTSDEELRRIEHALENVPPQLDRFQVAMLLRRKLPPDAARHAAEWFELRARAAARFPSGRLRYMTRRGLEQSSREVVAAHRARTIAAFAPRSSVYDATCGVGADSLALASEGLSVISGDVELETLRCARANLAHAGLPSRAILADAASAPVRAEFLVLDPDRRSRGSRSADARDASPSLAQVLGLLARFRGATIKWSPAFDIEELGSALPRDLPHFWQWVSADRELCETNLWAGAWGGEVGDRGTREAVALAADGAVHRVCGRPIPVVAASSEKVAGNFWLFSPDPAVVRAGLVGNLARELGATGLDPHLAFLMAPAAIRTPFARCWRVLASAPADPRRVRELLGTHDFGPVAVMKRGHPDRAEVLERRFRGPGRRRGLLAIARVGAGHLALVLDPGAEEVVGDEGIEPPTSSL